MLQTLGHTIEEAANDRLAARMMERFAVKLVLASVDPGDEDCLELLSYVRRKHPTVPVVLMFPKIHPERTKEALRLGAMAVLKYPVPASELRAAVLQALEHRDQRPASEPSPRHVDQPSTEARPASRFQSTTNEGPLSAHGFATASLHGVDGARIDGGWAPPERPQGRDSHPGLNLVGVDPGLRQIIELARTLAASQATVLLAGEPGTGKTELAQFLHRGSPRADRPFVVLDAADLIESETESENPQTTPDRTFVAEWTAKFGRAAEGTLYIKDVDQLGPELQLQLLRELQLQDMEAAAVHAGGYHRPFARLVLATSANLAAAVEQGRFRQDLYHRISSIRLMAPPLRHRETDIELLAEHFRSRYAHQFGRHVVGFTRDALDALQRHEWPGNVRELQGVIQRAVTLCNNSRIASSHLAPILNQARAGRGGFSGSSRPHLAMNIRPLKEALEEPEKQIIIQALQALNWNRQETAKVLDINRTTLYKKMKKFGLLVDEPAWVE